MAIANSRLISATQDTVTFKYKNYRNKGAERYSTMSLDTGEFIRRFLIHVLPSGFHRIRHYGLLSNKTSVEALSLIRDHLKAEPTPQQQDEPQEVHAVFICRRCGDPMIIIETMERAFAARAPPVPRRRA